MGGLEAVAPPTETGAAESYSIHQGQGRFHPPNLFKSFHLVVDHEPSSFAPNSYWSNKGSPHKHQQQY